MKLKLILFFFLSILAFSNFSYGQCSAEATTETFSYTGAIEQFTVPAGIFSITMTVTGADGGGDGTNAGGSGGTAIATYAVTPGEVLEVVVGEVGTSSTTTTIGAGGGGGSGVRRAASSSILLIGGGAGGAGNGIGGGGGLVHPSSGTNPLRGSFFTTTGINSFGGPGEVIVGGNAGGFGSGGGRAGNDIGAGSGGGGIAGPLGSIGALAGGGGGGSYISPAANSPSFNDGGHGAGTGSNGSVTFCLSSDELPPVQCNCGTMVVTSTESLWDSQGGRTAFTRAVDEALAGDTYTATNFNSASASNIFSSANCFVVLEGSDLGFTEFSDFITANKTLMQNWVNNGGVLFMNAAPNNTVTDLNVGFGGIKIVVNNFSPVVTGNATHPVFTDFAQPTDINMTGNHYGHSIVCPAGMTITSIITDGTSDILIETGYGDGLVMVGGMTTPNFHGPQPEAQNARQNMYSHGKEEACSRIDVSPPIPTMSQWGLMIFGLLTMNLGLVFLRRKEDILA